MSEAKRNTKKLTGLFLIVLVCFIIFLGQKKEAGASGAASSSKSEEKSFSVMCEDEQSFEALYRGKKKLAEQPLQALSFNGNELFYDSDSARWLYSHVEGDRWEPSVDFTSKLADAKLAFMSDGLTAATLAEAERIPMLIYTETSYFLCELSCTSLPIMNIVMHGALYSSEDVKAEITLFDNRIDAQQRWIYSDALMHIRGGITRELPKKNYKISLKSYTENGEAENRDLNLLGLRKDDDWHLSACYNDPERVRNVFSSDLWKQSCAFNNSFHADNGMRYEYIEVFINGRYHGLYALGYPIDAKQLNLGKTVFGESEEYLYKKVSFSDEILYMDARFQMRGYELKDSYNKVEDASAWQLLKTFYKMKINEAAQNADIIYDIVDIDNAVDLHLFIQLTQGVDNMQNDADHYGSIKNLMLTIKQKDGKPVMLYTPWDLDMTWGNGFINSASKSYTWAYKYEPSDNLFMYYSPVQQLLKAGDPEIAGLVKARYNELRESFWSEEEILKLLEEYEEDVFFSGAFARDLERWPGSQHLDGVEDLSRLKEYVLARLEFMDQYVESLQ